VRPWRAAGGGRGRAVQVDPVKPTVKAPGTKRLQVEYDELLSSLAFKFKWRRYNAAARFGGKLDVFVSNVVRRCKLNRSNP